MPQRRRRCSAMASSMFENTLREMLPGTEGDKYFERSVGDGGRDVYSRILNFPVKQQFTTKLPKYMLSNSLVEEEGKALEKSMEEFGRDIVRKASLTVKDITLEQVFSAESDVPPPAPAPDTPPKALTEEITGEYFEAHNVYEQTNPPDGSLQSGGAGRPEAKFVNCLHVRGAGSRECVLFVTPSHIILHYHSNLYDGESMALEEIKTRRAESHGSEDDEDRYEEYRDVDYRGRGLRFEIGEIAQIYLRRYRLRDSAVEIFFNSAGGGNTEGLSASSLFLDFGEGQEGCMRRDGFGIMVMKKSPRASYKQWPGTSMKRMVMEHSSIDKLWAEGKLSNFDYLMYVNTLAGRSFNDITQYPVFPWVLNDYTSDSIDIRDPAVYRDLRKPIGALNAERLDDFMERFNGFVDDTIPPFMYGSHYSTAAGVVLHYNVRLHPFAGLHRQLQGGHFDVADRLFSSVARTWEMCTSALSEVKELTPEWFSNPSFLRNSNNFNFGRMQDGEKVDDVLLPPWCQGSAEKFVETNRAALESDFVRAMLPDWIDLVFGYKQRGQAAVEAHNVFFYLTYYGSVDVAAIEDEALRRATELQIAHFGQCPMQLFLSPHVRSGEEKSRLNTLKNTVDLWGDTPDSESSPDLPFTGSDLSQWCHVAPPPPGPYAPISRVKIVTSSRIMTIDAAGAFNFYSFEWRVDQKSINKEKEDWRLKKQSLEMAERAEASLAMSGALASFGSRDDGELGSAGGGNNLVTPARSVSSRSTSPALIQWPTIDEDVGNFVVVQDAPSFRDFMPRLLHATTAAVITQLTFAAGTLALVVADGDGLGGMSVQVVDVVKGVVKSQVLVPNVASERISSVASDVCTGSGVEVVALGSTDGSVTVYRFWNAEVLPTRPIARFNGHNGRAITCVEISVHLRCVVSCSEGGRICIHNLVGGKVIRIWQCEVGRVTGVSVSKRGYISLACASGEETVLMLYSVEGREVGSATVEGRVDRVKDALDGMAVAVALRGAVQLRRVGALRTFEQIDTWGVEVGGFGLGGAGGGVGVGDVDFGPDTRLSSYPAIAVAGLADGSMRIHALPGVTEWSRGVGGGIGAVVGGLVSKPVNLVGGIGKGLVSIGREVAGEIGSEGGAIAGDVKKQGVVGWLGGLRKKHNGEK